MFFKTQIKNHIYICKYICIINAQITFYLLKNKIYQWWIIIYTLYYYNRNLYVKETFLVMKYLKTLVGRTNHTTNKILTYKMGFSAIILIIGAILIVIDYKQYKYLYENNVFHLCNFLWIKWRYNILNVCEWEEFILLLSLKMPDYSEIFERGFTNVCTTQRILPRHWHCLRESL